MKVLHPDKSEFLTLDQLEQYFRDYQIIAEKDLEELNNFLTKFEDSRKGSKILDTRLYKDLPYSISTITWKQRAIDIDIIRALIPFKNKKLDILDIGSWNGWLCNYFAKQGHRITGTGIFIDEYDGLKSMKHYDSKYLGLQLPIDDIYRIDYRFDLIVFNRCWAYAKNKKKLLKDVKKLFGK